MSRPQIKICGVTSVEDALTAVRLGADFLGLNFYPPSPRYVSPVSARQIRQAVGEEVQLVGVFVNRPPPEIVEIDAAVGLDLLQFHGDETRSEVEPFAARAIKVFRVGERLEDAPVEEYPGVWGFLFDSAAEGFGGSGTAWPWELVAQLACERPVFVAGGIRPGNVAALLQRFVPWGLDVCSGVESTPGRKDPSLLQRLFEEIGHAQKQETS